MPEFTAGKIKPVCSVIDDSQSLFLICGNNSNPLLSDKLFTIPGEFFDSVSHLSPATSL